MTGSRLVKVKGVVWERGIQTGGKWNTDRGSRGVPEVGEGQGGVFVCLLSAL